MANGKRYNKDRGFGRSSRYYEVDGRSLPSVTSVLQAINRPALINWSAKVEREAIFAALRQLMDDVPKGTKKLAFMGLLEDRVGKEKANKRIRDKAGDVGSQIHALAEWTLRKELKQEVGPRPHIEAPDLRDKAEWGFMAWEDWRKSVNMVPLKIEQTVWSNKHGYAGTFDLYCDMDLPGGTRGRVLADWKSSKAIYPESSLQIAAYVEALIEMDHAERPLHGLIVRVPKALDDPEFETKFIPHEQTTQLMKVFLNVLALWTWMDASKAL